MQPNEEKNHCDSCDENFPNAAALDKHRSSVHGSDGGGRRPDNPDPREMAASRPRQEGQPHRAEHTPPRGDPSMGDTMDRSNADGGDAERKSEMREDDPVQDRNGRSPDLPGKRSPPPGSPPEPKPSAGERPRDSPDSNSLQKSWESPNGDTPDRGEMTGRDDHKPAPTPPTPADGTRRPGSPAGAPTDTKPGGSAPDRERAGKERMGSEGPEHPKGKPRPGSTGGSSRGKGQGNDSE